MKVPQLLCSALVLVASAAACNRSDTSATAREAGAEVKAVASKAAAKAGDELADGWVTTKIQAQFFADDDIKARYISVNTRDGVVVLKGRVDSEEAHRQAVQTARNTDGVKQLVDELTVGPVTQRAGAPEQIEAAWIRTRVQARYFADPDVKSRDINVDANNGVVTLSGRVDTERERQQAVTIARETSGVTRVEDRLTVQPTAAPTGVAATTGAAAEAAAEGTLEVLDDGRITSVVQSKFFIDEMIKGRRINVDTTKGVVTLRGEVSSDTERAWALLLARTTDGVQRVEDNLTVNAAIAPPPSAAGARAGTTADDEALVTRIQAKFFADRDVKSSSVSVTAKDGVVLLEGTVPTPAVRQRALGIARETDGAVQVIDRLRVATTKDTKRTK